MDNHNGSNEMDPRKRRVGANEVWWLEDGPGSHGSEPLDPADVGTVLPGCFRFVEESDTQKGLRRPQLGALHAILAHRSVEADEPVTIVMPTGTGKTETMLAAFAQSTERTLVIVPSDALRTQIATKFATLGVLPDAEVVVGEFLCPIVGVLKSSLKTVVEADELLEASNVIVATAAVLARCSDEAMTRLATRCDRLFIDEAHHVAAKTWRAVADRFASKTVVQFTATPFREDAKHLGGRVAYAYPLRLAQERGYFAPINYHAITDLGDVDRTLATAALAQLRQDLANDFDHVLMARVQTTTRAAEVLELYQELASDLAPIRLDSKLPARRQREARTALVNRETRVVVCVDMLGEGFDLPALKVAAMHDPHKSLAVTLQFVGRFARNGESLGEASAFVPRQAGDLDDRLRRLYGEDSDWNVLVRDLTEAEVDRERDRSDFESGFGSLPREVALRSLQPKMSTVVFHSSDLQWRPSAVYDMWGEDSLLTHPIGINETERVAWWVSEVATPVRWGQFSNFAEVVHHLYVVHADLDRGLLFINSSDNDSVHLELAKAIGGDGVELIRGDLVYRVLAKIARRVPTNVGLLDAVNRNRRFTMHVGADVLAGFGPGAAQKSKTNIYAHGYAEGGRLSYGASRKGRVWSHSVAHNVLDWVRWARDVGTSLIDESIDVQSVMDGFIIPIAATERPPLVPLGIEWPYTVIANTSEGRQVRFSGTSHALLDLDLALTSWSADGPIAFEVRSDDWAVPYEMTFNEQGPQIAATGTDAQITWSKGTDPLASFMTRVGMSVFFEQEAVLSPDGYLIQPDRGRPRFDLDALEVDPWAGINIRKESQGPGREVDAVQYRVIERLATEADWEVIVDDDGKGEVADAVFLRRDGRVLELLLAHCKYSGGDAAGARLGDLYEVCGQAVKSHKARGEIELVLRKLIRRERRRLQQGRSGIVKGDTNALLSILQEARLFDARVTVVIAQPGVSKSRLTNPMSELLGCTQLYLSDTYGSDLRVLCSA